MAASPGHVLSVLAPLVTAVLVLNAALAGEPVAVPLETLRAAYNEDVRRLGTGEQFKKSDYLVTTPGAAVGKFNFGQISLENLRQLSQHTSVGRRIAIRGHLIISDAEEMTPAAAPRRVRLYGPPGGDGQRAFVPLDVFALSTRAGALLNRHCGVIPCPVTAYGRIGEVEMERVTNLFSPGGEMTAMVGLLAEHLHFHEVGP